MASNITNVATPGYKTKAIDLQLEFMTQMENQTPGVMDTPDLATKNDGNNVSLDREARLLAENALRFNLASSLMKSQLRMVSSAIQEGKSS